MITHPDKILFPDDGITKGEMAAYYEAIAPLMLPHLSGRPITMERYPSGISHKGFFHKDVSKGFPEWLERVEVPKKDGVVHHPLITDIKLHRSIRQFVDEFHEKKLPLHVLINNAGVMGMETRQTTEDGFEAQIGVNHLGKIIH